MSTKLPSVDDKDEILVLHHSKCKLVNVSQMQYSSLHRMDYIWVSTKTDAVEKTMLL
jgi:hypothetical protein